MKTFKFLFLSFIFIIVKLSYAQQDAWQRVSPTPQEQRINEIVVIPNTNQFIAVCYGSTIMLSDDLGESWQLIQNPAGLSNEVSIEDVFFINEMIGFAFTNSGIILKTTDGGYQWGISFSEEDVEYDFHDIYFVNDNRGFALADEGIILGTLDQGESWVEMESISEGDLLSVDFFNELEGLIISGNQEVFETQDGGFTWNAIDFPFSDQIGFYSRLKIKDDSLAFIYTSADMTKIFRTADKGGNWEEVYSDWKMSGDMDMVFLGENKIMFTQPTVVMYATYQVFSYDNGLSWEEQEDYLSHSEAKHFCNLDSLNIITAGAGGTLQLSSDAGQSWEYKSQRNYGGVFREVCFLNDQIAYGLSDSGSGGVAFDILYKTTVGGESWQSIKEYIMTRLGTAHFFNPDTLYVATYLYEFSTLEKSFDGGITWDTINTSIDDEIETMSFYDLENGLVSTENGFYRTSDGGESWESISIGASVWIEEIQYQSKDTVFIVGRSTNNSLFKSVDGGLNWEGIEIAENSSVFSMFRLNNQKFALGGNEIYISENGGETWTESQINVDNWLYIYDVWFTSQEIGYACGMGQYENLLKTTDGGNTWNVLESGITSNLKMMYFSDDNNGIVFGDNGVIIKTSTGGVLGNNNIEKLEEEALFTTYPNPVKNQLNIDFRDSLNENYCLELFNPSGQLLKRYTKLGNLSTIQLNTQNMVAGVYFIRILEKDKVLQTQKVIIQ